MPATAGWLLTKTLCYLTHLEATGAVRRVRGRAERWAGRRLDSRSAMRIDERIAAGAEPVVLLRVLPAQDRRGRARTSTARWRELSRLSTRRSSRSPTAPADTTEKRKTIDIVTDIKARPRPRGDGALHLRRAPPPRSCARRSTRCATRASRTCSRCAATRRAARRSGPRPRAACSYSRELIELIRDEYDFAIGAACFPETHIHATAPTSDLRYLKEKVDAGARFLITQLFFDNAALLRLRRAGARARDRRADHPGHHADHERRARSSASPSMCGATIPAAAAARARACAATSPRRSRDLGVAYATLQCADLLANGAPGIHFYTLNRSPATRAILSRAAAHRPWRDAVPGLVALTHISSAWATRGCPPTVPGDVDLVVLAVGPDAPGAQEPAPARACPPWHELAPSNTSAPPLDA